MANELTITTENFETEVLKSTKPVLVDFWATWCGPCRMLAPLVEDLCDEYSDKLTVGKVNVDEQPELAMKYRVSSIPTLIVFKNGQAAGQSVGYMEYEDLKDFVDQAL